MAVLAERFGWTEQEVDATIWFNVPRYVEEARRQQDVELLRDGLLSRGRAELVNQALEQAAERLKMAPGALKMASLTPIDEELTRLGKDLGILKMGAQGVVTAEMKKLMQRVDYLNVLKKMGKESDVW